jgi:putative membrane protein
MTLTKQVLVLSMAFCALGSVKALADDTADTAKLTDAKIASIMMTANDAEIDAAKLAIKKGTNSDVKAFADHMITEHKQNEKDGKTVAKKEDIKPEKTDESKMLKKDAQAKIKDLKGKKGDDFDKSYIALQVDMHKQLLGDLNDKFIPSAQDAEFKTFLETTKTHVEEHLARAQKIQDSLNK